MTRSRRCWRLAWPKPTDSAGHLKCRGCGRAFNAISAPPRPSPGGPSASGSVAARGGLAFTALEHKRVRSCRRLGAGSGWAGCHWHSLSLAGGSEIIDRQRTCQFQVLSVIITRRAWGGRGPQVGRKGAWGGRGPGADGSLGRNLKGGWGGRGSGDEGVSGAEGRLGWKGVRGGRGSGAEGRLTGPA